MRKGMCWGLLVVLALFLCACTDANRADSNTTLPVPSNTESTVEDGTTSVATGIPETTQEETETTAPAHTALYLPQYTTQQIIEYFEEVVLDIEYTDGTGDATLVQKWKGPIRYQIFGIPTDEDIAVLTALFVQLNEISGFPGIYAAADGELSNLSISFLKPEAFRASFDTLLNGEDAYGAVQFWYYTDNNEIHTANIGYRTDIDQSTRASVLLEEIVNMLGVSDTTLRTDSIVYQYSNDNTALSEIDWLIIKLLYDPAIQCGMDYESCRTIIQELYY